jgi:Fe-S cluster assembly iron-binding protein IscA
MLKMTPAAAMALSSARAEVGAPETYGVRLFAPRDADTGRPSRFGFDFVARPEPEDAVLEESGLTAYVAPEVTAAVGDATLDVEPDGDTARLVLRRDGSSATH